MNLYSRYLLLVSFLIVCAGLIPARAQQGDSVKTASRQPLSAPLRQMLNPADTVPVSHLRADTLPVSHAGADTLPPQNRHPETVPFSLSSPQHYQIAAIRVTGSKYLDGDLITAASGLTVGQHITLPGSDLADAINKLWGQGFFADVKILISRIEGDKIYLDLNVTERPRLANFYFKGVKKTESDELKTKAGLIKGRVITGNTSLSAVDKIKKYYEDKGYRNVSVAIQHRHDPSLVNSEDLIFVINKGEKIKINQINFAGNESVSSARLKKQMKSTKEMTRLTLHPQYDLNVYDPQPPVSFKDYLDNWGFLSFSKTRAVLDPYFRFKLFTSAKFNDSKFQEDKGKVLNYYNSLGYRDATIDKDTLYYTPKGNLDIAIKVTEGIKYYFGNIVWKGNTVYSDTILNTVLGIRKGDIYNLDLMDKRLGITPSQEGGDVGSLYLDNGYLFFHVTPVETAIHGDTIDFEMRIQEGPQANYNRIGITGNDKTNEHVIRRELRTLPGEKFSRQEVIRSQREIANLGFFDQEKITPNIVPNPQDGTVDVNWSVVEKPADKLELSAGWGGYIGVTGTVGMEFNNFSLRNILNKNAWRPLPSGDGQKLSFRVQSNGKFYSSYNFSFTEPWLGGKKRNPFTVSFYSSKFSNPQYQNSNYLIPVFSDSSYLKTIGATVSLGKQLHWPDDYFSLSYALSFQQFKLKNYSNDPIFGPSGFYNGISNNVNLRITLARNSTNQPIFPTSGSNLFLYGQFTPPYSLFNQGKDYSKLTPQEKFRYIEYQKYRFTGEWFVPISKPHGTDNKQLVLHAAVKFGFLGRYNSVVPLSPFERFELGGDGLSNYTFYGKDIISQRGYEVYYSSDPKNNSTTQPPNYSGFTIFNKFTLELRYPISLNPQATIFGLGFIDAGNGYNGIQDYNPFRLRRDAGIGMRFMLPMFGLLGFDYGVGFDRLQQGQGLKNATKFSFMLGYEPD